MAGISNADIMREVIAIKGEVAVVREIAESTQRQAEKTNGRVTKAEEFINALKAVEKYKKDQPATISAEKVYVNKWMTSDKLIAAVVGLLIAATFLVQVYTTKLGGPQ